MCQFTGSESRGRSLNPPRAPRILKVDIERIANMPAKQQMIVANWYIRREYEVWEEMLSCKGGPITKPAPSEIRGQKSTTTNNRENANGGIQHSEPWEPGNTSFKLREAQARRSRIFFNRICDGASKLQNLESRVKTMSALRRRAASTGFAPGVPSLEIQYVDLCAEIITQDLLCRGKFEEAELLTGAYTEHDGYFSLRKLVLYFKEYLGRMRRCIESETKHTKQLENALRARHKHHRTYLARRMSEWKKRSFQPGLARGKPSPLRQVINIEDNIEGSSSILLQGVDGGMDGFHGRPKDQEYMPIFRGFYIPRSRR
ncbi:hypothetical protein F4819DRAFT_491466 [Hypoxylon fuscum]|nr:hypothetical protein F4819DRAFT_491466 [Hypoxylon fuscum]